MPAIAGNLRPVSISWNHTLHQVAPLCQKRYGTLSTMMGLGSTQWNRLAQFSGLVAGIQIEQFIVLEGPMVPISAQNMFHLSPTSSWCGFGKAGPHTMQWQEFQSKPVSPEASGAWCAKWSMSLRRDRAPAHSLKWWGLPRLWWRLAAWGTALVNKVWVQIGSSVLLTSTKTVCLHSSLTSEPSQECIPCSAAAKQVQSAWLHLGRDEFDCSKT